MMAAHNMMILTALVVSPLIVFAQNSTSPMVCTSPPVVANANSTTNGLREGSVATYTCNTGFEPSGSLQRTCRNGIWVSSVPSLVCNAIYCSRPPSISRGSFRSLSGYRYPVGTVVTYSCYSGYVINGSSADLTCQANRSWTSPLPTCIKRDCGFPPQIESGNVSALSTDYLSTAIYSCYRGHDMYSNGYVQRSGTATIRCSSTGVWSRAPTCRPKTCSVPRNIINGIRFFNGNHKYQDTVGYECIHGYKLYGNNTIECLDTGTWSVAPECRQVECDVPPRIANGTTSLIGKGYFGNSTSYTCHRGFQMIGSTIISCQADGTWTQQPKCVLVDCRAPPAIHFGSHSWNSTTFMSEAIYNCDKGFKLIGVFKITCLDTGLWTNAPTCELPPGQQPPAAAKTSQQTSSESGPSSSAMTGLAIACAFFGIVTLLCLIVLVYKLFVAGKADKLFSYASYKNGDDVINSNI